jgi:hypothetical protein
MTSSSSQLFTLYQSSSPVEQAIIRLLSLNFGSMRQEDILTIVRQIIPGRLGTSLADRKEISRLLMTLEQQGLTCKEKGSAVHQPLIRNEVLLDTLEQKVFSDYNRCLEELHKGKFPNWGRRFFSFDQAQRTLQGQLFGNASLDEINNTLGSFYKEYDFLLTQDPLRYLFGSPVSPALLKHCAHDLSIGLHLLATAMDGMKHETELSAFLVQRLQEEVITVSPAVLVLYLAFTGELAVAEKICALPWASNQEPLHTCVLGCLHFLQGRYEQALLCFNESVAGLKKNNQKAENCSGRLFWHLPFFFTARRRAAAQYPARP